ncbi:MAG TPA: hypothetical protein VMT06_00445 [Candidatus Eisenbacteria bacterium]|nr:hypothetical protein [Candidatus Eisenbacteria bacterium]
MPRKFPALSGKVLAGRKYAGASECNLKPSLETESTEILDHTDMRILITGVMGHFDR